MPSNAYLDWTGKRRNQLEQLFKAHAAVGGSGPGRRFSTEQINHACITALSGQFQGFSRALLHEGIAALLDAVAPVDHRVPRTVEQRLALQVGMTQNLALDKGNPTRQVLEADFKRLGIVSLAVVIESTKLADKRVRREAMWRYLGQMNKWRNAVAHHDFEFNEKELKELDGIASPRLREVQRCQQACNQLAELINVGVGTYLARVAGKAPW